MFLHLNTLALSGASETGLIKRLKVALDVASHLHGRGVFEHT
jgi:hypothetical protein